MSVSESKDSNSLVKWLRQPTQGIDLWFVVSINHSFLEEFSIG